MYSSSLSNYREFLLIMLRGKTLLFDNIIASPASTSLKKISLQNFNLDDIVPKGEYSIREDGVSTLPVEATTPSNEDDFIEDSDDSVKDPDFVITRGMLRRRFLYNNQDDEVTVNLPSQSRSILQQGMHHSITSLTTNETNAAKKGKKRLCRREEWLSNKTKKARNLGEAYTSRTKERKAIPARSMLPPCNEKCTLKCTEKINESQRENKFNTYWKLGDITLQRNFIHKSIKPIIPKVRFTAKEKPRRLNHAFYLTFNQETQDLRGKNGHHHTVDDSIKQGVKDHISSIPRIESHYIRKHTTREFIEGGKTLADLYRDYKKDCETKQQPYANETMYTRIFNKDFNISFFTPKKDRCELCASYENAEGTAKENLKPKYLKHLEEKEESRREKERDKGNISQDNVVAVYDLQAVLQLPRGNTSVFYYKSKLNNLNLTISELNTDRNECYFWHEGEAKVMLLTDSTIEKQIQRRLKSGPIYVPSQYVEVIRSAKKKGRPYNLTEMSSCDFISLKTLAQDMGIHIQSFKISDVKILKIMKDSPTTLFYKTSFIQTEFLTAELSRKKNCGDINLKPAYRTKPKIKPNKINDLISLVESNHIPQFYASFYRSLNNN
ncbi:unnamed protein product [Euphydryas editha]|uniref:Uncharacterized protein n=1 Tax=Euphydryas editha TaxID=104508 RepID=A0AAU9UTV8_EUPED|nr:unnamed protein product [Euphydryas editha]